VKKAKTRLLLHRSENCVIYEETEEQIKKRLNKEHVRESFVFIIPIIVPQKQRMEGTTIGAISSIG
jgi:hypothetical protein